MKKYNRCWYCGSRIENKGIIHKICSICSDKERGGNKEKENYKKTRLKNDSSYTRR